MDIDALVVGGGSVGLAIEIGKLDPRCALTQKKGESAFLPGMERRNARTVEVYSRMGLSAPMRAAGLSEGVSTDAFVVPAMTERPLLAPPYSSLIKATDLIRAMADGTEPLKIYQHISHYRFELLLKVVLAQMPTVRVRFGCEFNSLAHDFEGVTAIVHGVGRVETIRARYLVGCEGVVSAVRKQTGTGLRGKGGLMRLNQPLLHRDELFEMPSIGNGLGHGRHSYFAYDRATFWVIQDSIRHWTLHSRVETNAEMNGAFERTADVPVDYEMLSCGASQQNLLLEAHYRDGRELLTGGAVHYPRLNGGLRMNTGTCTSNAADQSRKLASTTKDWGDQRLFNSGAVERRQVGYRHVRTSRYKPTERLACRSTYKPGICDASPAGTAIRRDLARWTDVEPRKTNETIGAELRYRCADLHVTADLPSGQKHLSRHYVATTWPEAHLPPFWLNDGTAIQSKQNDGNTPPKLRSAFRDDINTVRLERPLRELGLQQHNVAFTHEVACGVYGYDLLPVWPDSHVV